MSLRVVFRAVILSGGLLAAGLLAVGLPGGSLRADGVPAEIHAPPRNVGPAATAHSRVRRHRRSTVRTIRRTPEVMQEDAARIRRGDLFSTWSNAANN